MVQKNLFEEFGNKTKQQQKDKKTKTEKETQEKTVQKPKIPISMMPPGDCIHREKNKCLKTGKTITLDAREPDRNSCWNRMNCEHFEKKEEKKNK